MDESPTLDTHAKALAVNLDPTSFGSFAEIGAGQEVARWFLHVGAASGTVAKTVSAYDKEVSDDLYGSGTRYVSKPRLEAMLGCEWNALIQQVGPQRGATTRFFAFANTIAARNFAGTNDCHGWVGMRFQDRPGAEPNDVLIHVNLRDNSNQEQQHAVGILGVNLVHAMMQRVRSEPREILIERLFDNLTPGRIEVDQVELRGSAFTDCDLRLLHVDLARASRAEAITLAADGTAIAANEFLYKKSVIIVPIAGDAAEDLSADAVATCVESMRSEVAGNADIKGVVDLRLVRVAADGVSPEAARWNNGAALITPHQPLYRASAFVRRYTQGPVRFAMTLPAVMRIFDDTRYQQLDGRLLEGISRLFAHDVQVLAYPSRREAIMRALDTDAGRGWTIEGGETWIAADQIRPTPPLRDLYAYLCGTGFLAALHTG
jgi:hypothetical protein